MGRVDEALRRAAEVSGGPVPAPARDAEELANQAFPVELVDDVRPDPAADAALVPEADTTPRIQTDSVEPAGHVLLERFDASLAAKVVVDETMGSASREQYRRLAASLHHAQAATGLKVLTIVSAVGGEGKTLTASNLALTLSESYLRRVLLIDGDLRRPALHSVFRLNPPYGLNETLNSDTRRLPLHKVSERLTILPAGRPSSDPAAALTSDRMRSLIEEARELFDWVVIDTPPVALMSDANLLGAAVDGAVLVVKAGATPYQLVRRAVETLGAEKILGVVLNRTTIAAQASGYAYDDYYYGSRSVS